MPTYFNEMYQDGVVRAPYAQLEDWTKAMPDALRQMKQAEAEALFRRIGITFAVYGEGGDPDRLIPFDMFPRVFTGGEWSRLERGIKQRARALNAFLVDVYGRGEIVRAGRIPAKLVYQNAAYEQAVSGFVPPKGVYSHIVGIDLVRTGRDDFFLCAGGQLPHAFGCQLHAGKPRDHDADVPGFVPRKPDRAGGQLSRKAAPDVGIGGPCEMQF